jgi:hypothetical protein
MIVLLIFEIIAIKYILTTREHNIILNVNF